MSPKGWAARSCHFLTFLSFCLSRSFSNCFHFCLLGKLHTVAKTIFLKDRSAGAIIVSDKYLKGFIIQEEPALSDRTRVPGKKIQCKFKLSNSEMPVLWGINSSFWFSACKNNFKLEDYLSKCHGREFLLGRKLK